MKKAAVIIAALMCAVMLVGCNGSAAPQTPEEIQNGTQW